MNRMFRPHLLPRTLICMRAFSPQSRCLITTNEILKRCNGCHKFSTKVPGERIASVIRPNRRLQRMKYASVYRVSDEVQSALTSKNPVVALETTIYTHGFPYPDNVALALDLESIVRKNGGTPATIGVLDGVIRVGLNKEELVALAQSAGKSETMKLSRRDIPYILGMGMAGRKLNGGTTIAATMLIAQMAGIKVFGTGGLGGVHRGGQDTMDISADLTELGRTSVCVISSGCKSFLDIPRTVEYLETQGVTVCTFADGREGEIDLPAFFTRESGVRSPLVIQNAEEAAAVIYASELIKSGSGMLLANPIPEEFSIPKADIDQAIDQAVQEAADQGFHGHSNTPFILARIKELTDGKSIPANRALIESNVAMATKVAVELAKLRARGNSSHESISMAVQPTPEDVTPKEIAPKGKIPNGPKPVANEILQGKNDIKSPDIVVFGSLAVDTSCDFYPGAKSINGEDSAPQISNTDLMPRMHTSNMARMSSSVGGVGHNVTLAIHQLSGNFNVRLCTIVGNDTNGTLALKSLQQNGIDTHGIVQATGAGRTAQYIAMNDGKKDLVLAMADMQIFSRVNFLFENLSRKWKQAISKTLKWVVLDANWNLSQARTLLKDIQKTTNSAVKVAFEPVSAAKSALIFAPSTHHLDTRLLTFPNQLIDLATPNQHELVAMYSFAKQHEYFESPEWWKTIDAFGIPSSGARDRFVAITNAALTDEGIPLQTVQLLPFIPTILTKLGSQGVLLTELLKPDDPRLTDPDSARFILSRCVNGNTEVGGVYMRLYPAVEKVEDVISVNGVGDTFLGVVIAGLARGMKLHEKLIDIAQKGAVMTLRSKEPVHPELRKLLEDFELKE